MTTNAGETPSLWNPWAFVDALGDGVYGVDTDGLCIFINKAAVGLLGYEHPADLIGRNMHAAVHHTRADGSAYPQSECPLLHSAVSGRAVRLENEMLWRRDGTPFFAEYSSFPVVVGDTITGSVVTFTDTSVREDAQKRLAVQYAVSQVLSGSVGDEALPERILEAIGAGLGWDVGLFWRRQRDADDAGAGNEAGARDGGGARGGGGDRGRDVLRCMATWRSRDAGRSAGFGAGREGATLEFGAGLPGQAWFLEGPVRVFDLSAETASLGQAQAARLGLRSAFAFPIVDAKTVVGAVEFYSRQQIRTDESLLEAVFTLGQQIGQTLERRRVADALGDSEARFRTIANAIPQLAWTTDAGGAVAWYNQRWYDYTGTSFERMRGSGWTSLLDPDDAERVAGRFRRCIEGGEDWEDTYTIRAADGSAGWFLSRAMPIRDQPTQGHPQGRIRGWFGSNTDISSLRRASDELEAARDEAEAANLAKSTFIANMSHELRTPLSAIIGYAEMLVEELEEDESGGPVAGDVKKIEANARHLLGLINDVLDLSKVESGKMEAYAETFDVAAMAGEVAATVGGLVEKRQNRLVLQVPDGIGTMHSDVTRIRQMLLNLLSNAAKFTEQGTLTLDISRHGRSGDGAGDKAGDGDGGWLRFSVADTGIGMTAEQLAKLFQRFQQADASTTRQFGGTGLGLVLTKAFATLLGGEVEVASTPGEGSTFTFWLPSTLPAPLAAPHEDHGAGDGAADAAGAVVLVIDDDQTQLDLTSRFLVREGFTVRTAADGPTGLRLARSLRLRAILLDVTMPGMDGWSVLGTLKADPALAGIPVVMVTFLTERALALSLGAADYVVKPVDWNRLRHVMDRFREAEGEAEGDVLLVEDDPDLRRRTRQVLERNGWTVVEASNGVEGLARVGEALPRMVLLDLDMPVMNGFEFLAALRLRPGCAAIPVVVLTSMDLSAEDRRRLRGANQILNKGDVGLSSLVEKLGSIGTGR